jgi:hypothetical protein
MTREGERKAVTADKRAHGQELTRFQVLSGLANAANEIRGAMSAFRGGELDEPAIATVKTMVGRVREALESIEQALETDETGDWDRALAELQVQP